MLDSQDRAIQFDVAKPNVKNKLKNLLSKLKGFNVQITLHITFCKEIENGETKYSASIYFNSMTQTDINDLDIEDGLGLESVCGGYINISH